MIEALDDEPEEHTGLPYVRTPLRRLLEFVHLGVARCSDGFWCKSMRSAVRPGPNDAARYYTSVRRLSNGVRPDGKHAHVRNVTN